MRQSEDRQFRVLRPLLIGGRLAGTGEIIKLPTVIAIEQVEAGRLQPLEHAANNDRSTSVATSS